ncbi:MAG: hypothetical protein LQ342_005404 [Letrouitia transgressa]|nr:MAG: hypothetical protein LQ342_005404 [Letrouitia transgressa]
MKGSQLFILLLTSQAVDCALEYLTALQVPQGNCHQVQRFGNTPGCCNKNNGVWGQPCNGDLTGDVCFPDEILRQEFDGQAYFGDSRPVDQGDTCYPPGNYQTQKWLYTYVYCGCPKGYKVYSYSGNCDTGALCVGCNDPSKVLQGNMTAGYSCEVCGGLTTVSDPGLSTDPGSHQIVVDKSFATDAQKIIDCWTKNNPGGKVFPTSSSRCSASQGYTPAGDHQSDHQIGRALDVNLVFPSNKMGDNGFCNSTCLAKGYCAYHPTQSQCSSYKNLPQNAQNKMINDFFTCAQSTGLWAGAAHTIDSVHFERDVSDIAKAYAAYQPQLKTFCNKNCPKAAKGQVSEQVCNYDGYH